jgi:hypothetical protein
MNKNYNKKKKFHITTEAAATGREHKQARQPADCTDKHKN